MTDATIVVLVAAIPTTIGSLTAAAVALASLHTSRANGVKADEAKVLAVETGAKITAVDAKADVIHSQTNSMNSKLTSDLALANEKILGMERLMAQLMATKKETAATTATLLELAVAAPPPPPSDPLLALQKTVEESQRALLDAQNKMTDTLEHDRLNRKTGAVAIQKALDLLIPPVSPAAVPEKH